MARRPRAHELIVGVNADPVFGPVILFGHGGTAVEVLDDRAVGLPPLNPILARAMIARTRIARLLAGYRDRPPADMDAIARVLVRVADMVMDLPALAELDINPLWAGSISAARAPRSDPIRGRWRRRRRLRVVRFCCVRSGPRTSPPIAGSSSA
jgi:acetyltransferase